MIISYHSLEDRIVKNALRDLARGEVDQVTGRPRAETQLIEAADPQARAPLRRGGRPQPPLALGAPARGEEGLSCLRNAYALRRPVANTYLVRERDRRRTRELLLVLMMVVLARRRRWSTYIWIHLQVLKHRATTSNGWSAS